LAALAVDVQFRMGFSAAPALVGPGYSDVNSYFALR